MTPPAPGDPQPPSPIDAAPRKTCLSPKKLVLSKWTAVAPQRREKHFVVLRVLLPEAPATRIDDVELQAVHSGRCFVLPWRELTDPGHWRQGWV